MQAAVIRIDDKRGKGTGLRCSVPAIGTVNQDTGTPQQRLWKFQMVKMRDRKREGRREGGREGEREGGEGGRDCTLAEKREASRMSWMCLSQPEDSRQPRKLEVD